MKHATRKFTLATLGPGILVAATGVGAGDLATATLAGSILGTSVLWAVLVGAGLKYVLNEGLTRWQLATGRTLLEGVVQHMGRPAQYLFLLYLIVWSFLVAMALMSACGVTAHAILPWFEAASQGKLFFGIAHSLLATLLVVIGGYRLFEKTMSACIGLMFVVCCLTALAMLPSWRELGAGLLPRVDRLDGDGLAWTIALLGGVGGTVTVLCYGYWIREEGRDDMADLNNCRIDLAVGYLMTALFGLSMVIIGSRLGELQGGGATLIIEVADILQTKLGSFGLVGKWAFLLGAWGAVFSSLLGVWQSVPYLFVDFWRMVNHPQPDGPREKIDVRSRAYRLHLAALACLPIAGLYAFDFRSAMQVYGMVGALFIPMLAIALLILNGNARLVGVHRNSRWTTALLILALATAVVAAGMQLASLWTE